MDKKLDDSSRIIVFWLVIICIATVNLYILYHTFFSDGVMSFFAQSVSSIADALILFLPFVFLCRKNSYYIILVWFLFVNLLILGNIIYFRNFGDAICGTAYITTGNANHFVLEAIKSTISIVEVISLILCLSAVFLSLITLRPKGRLGKRFKLCYIGLTIIILAGQIGLSVRRISIYDNLGIRESICEYCNSFNIRTNWKSSILHYGVPGYLGRVIRSNINTKCEVSNKEIAEIIDILHLNAQIDDSALSVSLKENRGKNLILIIVESFNSKVLELEDAADIAPTMTALSKDSSNIYFPNILAMTGPGRSSDAQFMFNTGILPLRDEALVCRYADADYPSLSKTLGYNSIEIIGEESTLWSHFVTTKSYGFDRLVDNAVFGKAPKACFDSLIFVQAKKEIRAIKQPFFMQITTLGMHCPYTEKIGHLELENDYESSDLHYLEAVHAFDAGCAGFIQYLKDVGIFANSVIVIVADHEETRPHLSGLFVEKRIPMLILNSSLPSKKEYSQSYLQIDIYPTLLDIMGRSDADCFHGVGKSMLRTATQPGIPIDKAYEISEKLIKSKTLMDSVNASFCMGVGFKTGTGEKCPDGN